MIKCVGVVLIVFISCFAIVRWKHGNYLLFRKYLKKNSFIPFPHKFFIELNLKTFVMQLKRQSVEAWQNEKHYSNENTISQNPIPRREIFKSVNHEKYEGQVRSQHSLFVQIFPLSFQAVVLLTKTSINRRTFFNLV